MLQLQNRTYFHLTKYERRETIGEIKDVNECIHIIYLPLRRETIGEKKDVNACIHIIYLPEEWLSSNGLRSFPQYRPPNVVNS